MSKYHTITTKITYHNWIYIFTLISFITIFLFLTFFTIHAPGNYFQSEYGTVSIFDTAFATILLINNIFVILSFIEFIKHCYRIYQKKHFSLKQFGEIIVCIYPIILVFFFCNWNIHSLYHYLLSPIQILFHK